MHSNRVLKATLITFILVLGSLPALFFIPTAGAESIEGETTLYFHDFFETEGMLDSNLPTKENDSEWPPSITNFEEWLVWFGIASTSFLFNDSEFEEDPLMSFFNPFRVSGLYFYEGNDTLEIKGDIVFDLYFKSPLPSKLLRKDDVKVTFGWLSGIDSEGFSFTEVNTTIRLKPKLIGKIQEFEITIEDVNHTLKTGDLLTFAVEIIPGDKIISKFIGRLNEERLLKWGERFAGLLNESKRPSLNNISAIIKEMLLLADEANITMQDVAEIVNAMRSSSFIYDSVQHPSSITVPLRLPGEDESKKFYYLHSGNTMDTTAPQESKVSTEKLSDTIVKWDGPVLDNRNKIIKDVSVNLYLQHRKLKKSQVAATLFDGDTEIASSIQEVGFDFFGNTPTTFTFEDLEYELFYGRGLSLGVSLANGSKPGILRKTSLLYDSSEKPSSVKVTFVETDNIQFDYSAEPEDGLIIPGEEVKYTLDITSERDDDISVDISEDKDGDWEVTIEEDMPIGLSAGGSTDVHISVKSENNKEAAYGDTIDLTFVVSGKTGLDRQTTTAEVSEDAIEYDVDIVGYTKKQSREKGKNANFYFIIENKNTGAIDDVDSYTISASSKNNWNILYTDSITDLEIGEKTGNEEIKVIVSIPENTTKKSDTITFTITSDGNNEAFAIVNVTLNVKGPGIFDSIYDFFKELSKTLGLDEIFGENAPFVLMAIIMIIILFILIILALVLTRRFVNLTCTERIKEIGPDGKAVFDITIENPNKKTQIYEISVNGNIISSKWDASLDKTKVTVEGRQSETVFLTVKTKEVIEPNGWTEAKVKVNIPGRKKSEEITTMVIIKDGKTFLRIKDVFNWPKEFKKDDKVITSLKLENNGNITAKNVNVILYINGKEKNKVEVTIPSGGYADIRIPWIAEKGKNELHIKAVEQQ